LNFPKLGFRVLPKEVREVLVSILEEIEKQREERVTRKEFQELRDVVKELAQAQRRTEERLTRLEETVEKLAEAQRKTEERVNELAQAQRRTEEEIARLTGEVITLKKEVGGLAHTVGYRLEDEAMKALPEILKKEMNLGIIGRLRRDFIETKRGKFVEVNIWGEGRVDGKDYIIIGEAKTQLKKSDIDSFIRKAEEIKKFVPGEQVRILVTYIASPPVRKYAEEKGIKLYFSYEF